MLQLLVLTCHPLTKEKRIFWADEISAVIVEFHESSSSDLSDIFGYFMNEHAVPGNGFIFTSAFVELAGLVFIQHSPNIHLPSGVLYTHNVQTIRFRRPPRTHLTIGNRSINQSSSHSYAASCERYLHRKT